VKTLQETRSGFKKKKAISRSGFGKECNYKREVRHIWKRSTFLGDHSVTYSRVFPDQHSSQERRQIMRKGMRACRDSFTMIVSICRIVLFSIVLSM